jgi:hypothetical protein
VQLTLLGPGCDRVRRIDLSSDGMTRLRASSELAAAASPGVAAPGAAPRCPWRIELPFDAYGKTLKVQLEPEAFSAPPVSFTGSALELPISRRLSQRRPEPPKPCVPPEYCRD